MSDKRNKNRNGEGSFRVQSGKWNYRFTYKDAFGKSHRKSITADSKEKCLMMAARFKDRLKIKSARSYQDATIVEILEEKYKSDHLKNYTSDASYSRNLANLNIIRKHPISEIPIADITLEQMDQFLVSITSYSDSVIKKIYNSVNAAFRIARDSGLITQNIMSLNSLKRPQSEKTTKSIRAFTSEEQQRFIETLKSYEPKTRENDYRIQLLIELYSGMRMGEINALHPDDIDLEHRILHVRSTVSLSLDENKYQIKSSPKTEAGFRDVPVCEQLIKHLQNALDKMEDNPYGLVFYNHKSNSIIATNAVNSFFKQILKKAGIKERGQHALRHTFATRCIESGVPAIVLKNWMGHTDIHVTLDTYADVFDSMNRDAISKYDEYMSNLYK